MSAETELQHFITKRLEVIEPLSRKAALASWEMQTTGSEEATNLMIDLSKELARVYANKSDYDFLENLPESELTDAGLARQRRILLNHFLSNQVPEEEMNAIIALEVEIECDYNNYRAELGGASVSDNEIDELLTSEKDSTLREEAWKASKRVGEQVAERVLKLVKMRNAAARKLGFDNFYSMGLHLQELDEERLFTLLDDLHAQTAPIWTAYRSRLDSALAERFSTTVDKIMPWHFQNKFFQEPDHSPEVNLDRFYENKDLSELTSAFLKRIALPCDDLIERADLYEREGKCQHAFCMDVDRKGDVRVLCNNRPNARWMETTLHEFGHAVYDKFHDPELPYLLREPAHTMTTEAIALFMGRLAKDPDWLIEYAEVPEAEAQKIGTAAKRQVSDHLLVFMHWCFVMANFERALYKDPEQDLNALWWDLVEKYQKVKRPEGRNAPDWAAKVHLATAPVYYHNYQLGEMIASQLLNFLNSSVLTGEPAGALVTSPKVGEWMKKALFYPGATRPWEEWLSHATGEPLNPAHFVDQLS